MRKIVGMLIAVGLLATAASAQEVVIRPINSTLEPNGTAYIQFHPRWIDGSGITNAASVETGQPIPATWPGHIAGYHNQRIERIRDANETDTLTFDLGGIFEVTGMVLWNSTELNQTARGFENTVLSYSTDGGATFTAGETLTWTQRLADQSAVQNAEPYTYYSPEDQTLTTSSGPGVTHVRMVVDNFSSQSITMAQEIRFTGVPAPKAYYVAATRTDWTVGSSWSDGNPAMVGTQYFATNDMVVLETPATTATFPGAFLSLENSQRMELMVTGSDVITIDPLRLDGAELAASVVGSGEAKLDGEIIALGGFTLGTTNATRDLRILSEINSISGVPMQLSTPGQTIFIDNTNNTVAGIWSVNEGTTVEFADGGAVGLGSIIVSNSTLRINGDWDGLSSGEYLNVFDTPSALVDLGTNAWTVNALQVGSSNVLTGFTYDAAQLNSIGSNAMFTGTGTIQIGDPYIPPPPPTNYYLHANNAANTWIGEQEWWYNDPVAGDQMPYYAIFEGSTFYVNGFGWRTQNTAATSIFKGLLVQDSGNILIAHYAGDQRLEGGMILSNSVCTLRPHRATGSGLYVSDMQLDATGKLELRLLESGGTDYHIQNLSFGTISGGGAIQFGGVAAYDNNGIWSLAVEETCTNFTGIIDLVDGELTFTSEVNLPEAQFTIAGADNTIVLSNNVVFGSLILDGYPLLNSGVHTAGDLNTLFETDRFSGDGTVGFEVVIPPLVAPVITGITLDGADLVISGTSSNVNADGEYRLIATPDLVAPGWAPVSTNTFDENGDFSVTYPIPGAPEEFYAIEVN